MIFDRREGIPAQEVDEAQRLSDPRTAAPEYLETTWTDLYIQGVHPWAASDLTLLKATVAANCYTSDMLAEGLRTNCVVRKTRHGDELSPDAHAMALALSIDADSRMHDYVEGLPATQHDYPGIFEENRVNLDPAQLPGKMPRTSRHTPPEDWQDQAPGAPVVTTKFIATLAQVARDIHVEANSVLDHAYDQIKTGVPVPPHLADTREVIEEYIQQASEALDSVETSIALHRDAPELPESIRGTIYGRAVQAYCMMALAYAGSVAPAIMGPDFMPER